MRLLMDMTTPWWSWNELDFLIMSVRSHFRQYVTFNRALPLLLDIVFFFLDGTRVAMTTSPHSTQARKRFDSESVLIEGGRGEFVFVERGFVARDPTPAIVPAIPRELFDPSTASVKSFGMHAELRKVLRKGVDRSRI